MSDFKIGDEVQIRATIVNVDDSENATLKYEMAFADNSVLWIPGEAQISKFYPLDSNEEATTPPAENKTTVINVDDGDEVTLNGRKSRAHKVGDSVMMFADEE